MRPRLAVSLGDARGIGPEIVARALADERVRGACELLVVGPDGCGVGVHESVGDWHTGGSAALAGQFAGRAIERAAHLAGVPVAMMLASERLRVVLATTHIPLAEVPRQLTREHIVEAARITRSGLREWYGIPAPRIALCALNPHAGDGGRFGSEDDTLLAPAASAAGIAGPFPADTVFVRALRGEFDAVIAPYHDVGMTAIKVASFGQAVNVTLGLPFPRTSPDHGTALDIAGQGKADPGSMIMATLECVRIANVIAQSSTSGRTVSREPSTL